jgi:hypothetical protein
LQAGPATAGGDDRAGKEKRVKQTELEARAEKVRRETVAAAAAAEQVIAAKAQEEAIRHLDAGYAAERWASEPCLPAAFSRWSDVAWKQGTISLRSEK